MNISSSLITFQKTPRMKSLKVFAEERRHHAEAKDKFIIKERKKLSTNVDYILTPSIVEFFRGGCVFITGGTGFVGKVLTEKLLRSCPDIDKIYFLVREKKGKNPEDRIKDLLKSELFEKISRENPDALTKIIPIVGDVSELGLALSEDDRMLLQNKTTVVFHAAATVRFDDPFSKAVLLNCRGTREIVELCKSMLRLKSMVHVSTTYCNTDRAVNEEIVYPAHFHWRDVIRIAESDDPDALQKLNNMLVDFFKVIATLSDPLEGWWDTFVGPPGINVGVDSGVLRVLYANPEVILDYFAVDYVIRELILLAWIRGTGLRISTDPDEIDVVNMSVTDCYEASLAQTYEWAVEVNKLHPPLGIRSPAFTVTRNRLYFMYRVLTAHVLFSIIVDVVLRLAGKEARLLKIYRRVQGANNAVEFFLCNKYTSISEKYTKSLTFLKEEDQDRFGQPMAFDFLKYSVNAKLGINKYLVRKTPDYKWNRNVQRVLKVINWLWQGVKIYGVYRLLKWILL